MIFSKWNKKPEQHFDKHVNNLTNVPKILFILGRIVISVNSMLNKKLLILGILALIWLLVANVTMVFSALVMETQQNDNWNEREVNDTPTLKIDDPRNSESITVSPSEPQEPEPFLDEEMEEDQAGITGFESLEAFKSFLENNTYYYRSYRGYSERLNLQIIPNNTILASISGTKDQSDSFSIVDSDADGYSSTQHSTTNIQVLGVDEGDIIKNDGKYAYIISKDKQKVIIAEVYPAESAKIVSNVWVKGRLSEIYVNNDRLVLLGYGGGSGSFIHIIDIKDRAEPYLVKSYHYRGTISQSRMIGDYLYLITWQSVSSYITLNELSVQGNQIYYFDDFNYSSYYSHQLTTIISINVKDTYIEPVARAILMEKSHNILVSVKNIYITYTKYLSGSENTIIHRIAIHNRSIQYKAKGEVLGRVLNRFSMGEFQDYFRIVTSTGHVWRGSGGGAQNHVYVLDMKLNTTGKLINIASGERLYSARFIGNRAYLVTFKKVDPFFVIDLTNPKAPKILGELKIPGYSDYLHPYDENHIIGLGKDTHDMGTFAWYQGVKLSLFDVSDVSHPKEVSKYIIGDRGTYSPASTDPHAFMFSREKNLLVLPISLAEINQTKYPNGASPSTSGEYTWEGVYVLNISAENGFSLKGRISHFEDGKSKSGYWNRYGNNDKTIKRSFYINDVLYTFSSEMLKMNHLNDLDEINELTFPEYEVIIFK